MGAEWPPARVQSLHDSEKLFSDVGLTWIFLNAESKAGVTTFLLAVIFGKPQIFINYNYKRDYVCVIYGQNELNFPEIGWNSYVMKCALTPASSHIATEFIVCD